MEPEYSAVVVDHFQAPRNAGQLQAGEGVIRGVAGSVAQGTMFVLSARVAGDLAEHREDYAPAARWAATTWTHAPRIAAKALERGIPYPRFSDDEMTHLVAFLRSGSRAR